MPFKHGPWSFTQVGIGCLNETGGVYGLFQPSARAGFFRCLYVGETDNLRRTLGEHLSDPPIAGVTHVFAEGWQAAQQRKQRELELIDEFNPPANTVGRRRHSA